MRPQRNAAENVGTGWFLRSVKPASMRPQRNAAENPDRSVGFAARRIASMRPQRNAAENLCSHVVMQLPLTCFNEAAA